jgi:hypothetical protein
MNLTGFWTAVGVGLLMLQPAWADTLQCGTNLVNVGDEVYTLLEKCGEPTLKDGDNWIYNQGPDSLVMVVQIAEGKVQSIQAATTASP